MIAKGSKLPDASFPMVSDAGFEIVRLSDRLNGRRVVIFAVPGAFTPTCDSAHMPSFVRSAKGFAQKGVDEIMCLSVNDPHVMRYWARLTGATEAGITMLADADASFTKAIGMDYTNLERGMIDRSKRYAMFVEDGVVTHLHLEEATGVCEISGGEAMLAVI
jgi:cytochrome c peroxidase